MNILKKYIKEEVITTGTDNVELDSPTFEIISININTVDKVLSVEILHEVAQGTLTQKHSRTFDVQFDSLTAPIKVTGKDFLDAIEAKILELPQYNGATEV